LAVLSSLSSSPKLVAPRCIFFKAKLPIIVRTTDSPLGSPAAHINTLILVCCHYNRIFLHWEYLAFFTEFGTLFQSHFCAPADAPSPSDVCDLAMSA
jgi:hypothetical protein